MMRAWPIFTLLLLAACGNHAQFAFSTGLPGPDVAEAALRGGSPQVALQIDNAILAKDPHNVRALLNRADVMTAQQDFDAAADGYEAVLRIDPRSVPARIGLGRLRLADDASAAERLFEQALQQQPNNAVALNDLGIARDLQGEHRRAQAAYRHAMGIDPLMIGARVNLALSLAMTGRAADAAPMLRPLAAAPSASRKLRHDYAAVLAMGGEQAAAQQILSQDMSPARAREAVAIFTAASDPAADAAPAAVPQPPVHAAALPAPRLARTAPPAPTVSVQRVAVVAVPAPQVPAAAVPNEAIMVQLSSETTSMAADARWQALERQMPALLANRQPILMRAVLQGQVFWRLRTGGFADKAEADAFCRAVQAKGGACYVTGA